MYGNHLKTEYRDIPILSIVLITNGEENHTKYFHRHNGAILS